VTGTSIPVQSIKNGGKQKLSGLHSVLLPGSHAAPALEMIFLEQLMGFMMIKNFLL
jgi:hypothetical protein